MKPRSLGYRTELIFVRFDGKVTERGDYLVAETPSNPTYQWGNFLFFARPPALGDFVRWQELFKREFVHEPRTRHMTLGWDSPEGELGFVQPFVDGGFELIQDVVQSLEASGLRAPKHLNAEISVRPLQSAEEWKAALENQVAARGMGYEEKYFREYLTARMARMQRMSEQGLGHCFGAFLGERLVGDLGIFRDGKLGRFQSVSTHLDFRGRGICATMVNLASRFAFEQMGLEQLVIIAGEGTQAARIYASLGFVEKEKALGVQKKAK